MRYSERLVQQVTGEAPVRSPVGWAGEQKRNDSLTWAESFTFSDPNVDINELPGPQPVTYPQQDLIRVHYERPTSWNVKLTIVANFPAGEITVWTVVYRLFIGVGTKTFPITRSHTFTSPQPAGDQFFEDTFENTPFQMANMNANVILGAGGLNPGSHVIIVSAAAAPVFQ